MSKRALSIKINITDPNLTTEEIAKYIDKELTNELSKIESGEYIVMDEVCKDCGKTYSIVLNSKHDYSTECPFCRLKNMDDEPSSD